MRLFCERTVTALSEQLTDEEHDRLSVLLDQRGSAMNLEMLDGFFAALICSPELVPPSEYLPRVWGEAPLPWTDERELREFYDLAMRHWNAVAHTLYAKELYLPLLLEDEVGNAPGNDWAEGFTHGMKMRSDAWSNLFDDADNGGIVIPILTLAHEHDPDPTMRPFAEAPTAEERQKLLVSAAASVPLLYRYFAGARRQAAPIERGSSTFRREGAKVRRNDPCPCGSNKKFKKCCGAVSLH